MGLTFEAFSERFVDERGDRQQTQEEDGEEKRPHLPRGQGGFTRCPQGGIENRAG